MEYKLQDKIIEFLKSKKIWHFRYSASSTFGIPDILALYKGYFICIEVKDEDGTGSATLLQKEVVKSIQRNGGLAAVVDDLADVEELITEVDYIDSYELESEIDCLPVKWTHTP